MSYSIALMKERITHLEQLIKGQPELYTSGYFKALVDNGILLSDIPYEELSDDYKIEIKNKAFNCSK